MILAIFYWIGYAIVFLTLFVFGVWAFANKERSERENPDRDISFFNVIFALLVLPWFS